MIEDRIKIKINSISYYKVGDATLCDIYYSIYINKFPIKNNLFTRGITICRGIDNFNTEHGKNIARAYAELKVYKSIIYKYASDIITPEYKNYYFNKYFKIYQCMMNTRKYYKNLIKKQYKYINSLLKK